jgi:condensin complex subunit 2
MNHLGIDGTGRVVFDAGDAVIEDYDDEEELEDEQVDIAALRSLIPSEEDTVPLTISETLGSFHFGAEGDFAAITGFSSFNDEPEVDAHVPTGEAHDFFGDEDYDVGGAPGGFDDGMSMAGDEGDFDAPGEGAPGEGGAFGYGAFDPRRAQGLGNFSLALGGSDDPDSMFQYFDSGFGKAWAGAEHWKLRKISRKGELRIRLKLTFRYHCCCDTREEGEEGRIHDRLQRRRGLDQGAVCTWHQDCHAVAEHTTLRREERRCDAP